MSDKSRPGRKGFGKKRKGRPAHVKGDPYKRDRFKYVQHEVRS